MQGKGQEDQGELIAYVPVKVALIDENAADLNYITRKFNKRK